MSIVQGIKGDSAIHARSLVRVPFVIYVNFATLDVAYSLNRLKSIRIGRAKARYLKVQLTSADHLCYSIDNYYGKVNNSRPITSENMQSGEREMHSESIGLNKTLGECKS